MSKEEKKGVSLTPEQVVLLLRQIKDNISKDLKPQGILASAEDMHDWTLVRNMGLVIDGIQVLVDRHAKEAERIAAEAGQPVPDGTEPEPQT